MVHSGTSWSLGQGWGVFHISFSFPAGLVPLPPLCWLILVNPEPLTFSIPREYIIRSCIHVLWSLCSRQAGAVRCSNHGLPLGFRSWIRKKYICKKLTKGAFMASHAKEEKLTFPLEKIKGEKKTINLIMWLPKKRDFHHTYIFECVCVCVYICIHIHTHIYMYTCTHLIHHQNQPDENLNIDLS